MQRYKDVKPFRHMIMKKLIYLLMLLPLAMLGGCHDDDDIPDVNVSISLRDVVVDGNVIYTVKDTPLKITSISVQGVGSRALVTSVAYYWDGVRIGWNPIAPFSATIAGALVPEGNHVLGISMEVAQEGKALGFCATTYNVKAVENEDALPEGTEPGPATITYTGSPE